MLHTSSRFCCRLLTSFIQKSISGTKSKCQTVWIQIILLVLIWIQTVFKCYQQMTKVAASREIVSHPAMVHPCPAEKSTYYTDLSSRYFSTFSYCKLTEPIIQDQKKFGYLKLVLHFEYIVSY